jgi:hypothetical protein
LFWLRAINIRLCGFGFLKQAGIILATLFFAVVVRVNFVMLRSPGQTPGAVVLLQQERFSGWRGKGSGLIDEEFP